MVMTHENIKFVPDQKAAWSLHTTNKNTVHTTLVYNRPHREQTRGRYLVSGSGSGALPGLARHTVRL